MKRLYKIILLFIIIFLSGIYFTLKSIDMAFVFEYKIENISMKSDSSHKLNQTIF